MQRTVSHDTDKYSCHCSFKEYDYNAEVEIINPVADTVTTATFQGADVDWFIKADDIVLKNKQAGNNHAPNNSQQQGKKQGKK